MPNIGFLPDMDGVIDPSADPIMVGDPMDSDDLAEMPEVIFQRSPRLARAS
jgi:hypothetical protein